MLREHETLESLGRKDYKIIQSEKLFKFGIDSVLISDFINSNKESKILDLGTGNGVIPLLVYSRDKAKEILGIEIQDKAVDLAERNFKLNNKEKVLKVKKMNIKDAAKKLKKSYYDFIITNPPYIKEGEADLNSKEFLAIARHEKLCNLEDIIYNGSRLVKVKGSFNMINRIDRFTESIILLKKYDLSPKRIRYVHLNKENKAKFFMIEAIRKGKEKLKVERPLYIYDKDGNYTKEIKKIYNE